MKPVSCPSLAGLLLVGGCAGERASVSQEFLVRCWNAVKTESPAREYELSFEAILIPTEVPKVFTWSRSCRNARMGLVNFPPPTEGELEQFSRSIEFTSPGVGLRGRVRVVPLEMSSRYFLRARVTRVISLEQMNQDATRSFVDRHQVVW